MSRQLSIEVSAALGRHLPLKIYDGTVARKRHYDLRDYWHWYEPQWPTRGGRATRPPFTLRDIAPDEPPVPGRKWLQAVTLCAGAVLLAYVVWAVFLAEGVPGY